MLKYSTKCLTILLAIVSAVSLVNVLVMYWFPINIPLVLFLLCGLQLLLS